MDNNKLDEALKSIDNEKLEKVKAMLGEKSDISSVLSGIDKGKAKKMLKEFNISPDVLGSALTELLKKPDLLNEIKNKLK